MSALAAALPPAEGERRRRPSVPLAERHLVRGPQGRRRSDAAWALDAIGVGAGPSRASPAGPAMCDAGARPSPAGRMAGVAEKGSTPRRIAWPRAGAVTRREAVEQRSRKVGERAGDGRQREREQALRLRVEPVRSPPRCSTAGAMSLTSGRPCRASLAPGPCVAAAADVSSRAAVRRGCGGPGARCGTRVTDGADGAECRGYVPCGWHDRMATGRRPERPNEPVRRARRRRAGCGRDLAVAMPRPERSRGGGLLKHGWVGGRRGGEPVRQRGGGHDGRRCERQREDSKLESREDHASVHVQGCIPVQPSNKRPVNHRNRDRAVFFAAGALPGFRRGGG